MMFLVSLLSRFMHNPSKHYFGAAKRVLRYVKGTLNYGFRYGRMDVFKLYSYTNSDWTGCADSRKRTSRFVHSLGSGVISWATKKQQSSALLSSEAEYITTISAACQTIWLRRILAGLQERQDGATQIYCDNKSTIAMTKNPMFYGCTKHTEVWHQFIQDLVDKEEIQMEYYSTNDQLMDIFTKALEKEKFYKFRRQLGVS